MKHHTGSKLMFADALLSKDPRRQQHALAWLIGQIGEDPLMEALGVEESSDASTEDWGRLSPRERQRGAHARS